ncbi:MAG: HAMP domain-containing protein [Desulfomonilaceae bacterium]|nr:HAMP domain-containing protein [Desulfomonilaceae bacterium]
MAPEKRKVSPFSSGSDAASFSGKRLSTRNSQGLLRRLLIFFCLLGLIAVGVNVKILLDTNAEIHRHMETGPKEAAKQTIGAAPDSVATLQAVRTRIAVLLGTIVVCFGFILYFFVKRVVLPLNRVTKITQDMSRGNLSVSALRNPHGDVGELGAALNDLAANFQEVLLLLGTTVGKSSIAVESIEKALEKDGEVSRDEVRKHLEDLRKDLLLLRSLVQDFDFYQTHFDGQKVVSDNIGRES